MLWHGFKEAPRWSFEASDGSWYPFELERFGADGWELVEVVPISTPDNVRDQVLKGVVKKSVRHMAHVESHLHTFKRPAGVAG